MKSCLGRIRRFLRREDGLVTLEWVALAAGMVVAAIVIGFIVMDETAAQADNAVSGIAAQVTTSYGTGGANLGP